MGRWIIPTSNQCPLHSPTQIESFKPFFIIYHGEPALCQSNNTTQKQFFLELNFIEQFVLRSGTKLRQILFAQDNFKINFQHGQRKRPGTTFIARVGCKCVKLKVGGKYGHFLYFPLKILSSLSLM